MREKGITRRDVLRGLLSGLAITALDRSGLSNFLREYPQPEPIDSIINNVEVIDLFNISEGLESIDVYVSQLNETLFQNYQLLIEKIGIGRRVNLADLSSILDDSGTSTSIQTSVANIAQARLVFNGIPHGQVVMSAANALLHKTSLLTENENLIDNQVNHSELSVLMDSNVEISLSYRTNDTVTYLCLNMHFKLSEEALNERISNNPSDIVNMSFQPGEFQGTLEFMEMADDNDLIIQESQDLRSYESNLYIEGLNIDIQITPDLTSFNPEIRERTDFETSTVSQSVVYEDVYFESQGFISLNYEDYGDVIDNLTEIIITQHSEFSESKIKAALEGLYIELPRFYTIDDQRNRNYLRYTDKRIGQQLLEQRILLRSQISNISFEEAFSALQDQDGVNQGRQVMKRLAENNNKLLVVAGGNNFSFSQLGEESERRNIITVGIGTSIRTNETSAVPYITSNADFYFDINDSSLLSDIPGVEINSTSEFTAIVSFGAAILEDDLRRQGIVVTPAELKRRFIELFTEEVTHESIELGSWRTDNYDFNDREYTSVQNQKIRVFRTAFFVNYIRTYSLTINS